MGILNAVGAFLGRGRHSEKEAEKEEALRAAYKARCSKFKALLSANKRALATVATLEAALQGERLFGMTFVRANCTIIVTSVFNMVRQLNALSADAHIALYERIKIIRQRISEITFPQIEATAGPFVLPLEKADFSVTHEVGGKMASLGEARQRLGSIIPGGFVVTASGFNHFMAANNLQEEINRRMQLTDMSRLDAVFALSSSLQQLIFASPIPEDLAAAIMGHYGALVAKRPGLRLAVRSSAIGEDEHGSSYAGQYRSELNVSGDNLLDTYKEVIASKYGVTAMSYRISRGIPDDEAPMCVGCLEMVAAVAGGVAYSADPLGGRAEIVINAVPGLPGAVVDGSADVDVFRVERSEPYAITGRNVVQKYFILQNAEDEGVVRKALSEKDGAAPCLDDGQIRAVARAALDFEKLYGLAQDVEWVFNPEGDLVILQTRPLQGLEKSVSGEPLPEGASLLLEGGVCASPGVGAGPVFFVRRDADMLGFPQGAVLVIEQAHARWAPVLSRAAAVVSEYGGTAGHLASVAREYGVPAVFGLKTAFSQLEKGAVVTVMADSCRVLAGRVEELLAHKKESRGSFAGSPVYRVLEKAMNHIAPLNLLDPESAHFAPEYCETMHDITRYAHEKAVKEMFRMDDSLCSGRCGKQLKYKGGKLQYFVVNIENGFRRHIEGRYVELEDISCPPWHALWQGMVAVVWAGPVATTGRGFLSLVAQSAGNPDLEITRASSMMLRNYVMVDKDYCNLQASFGYHFCTIEAQAGEREQENYVNFHFKGGAANLGRRLLRVNVIADVLAENGFIVEVKEDALSARAEELTAGEALELLRILGYLIIHTRQMDVGLHEDNRSEFGDMLRKGIAYVLGVHTGK